MHRAADNETLKRLGSQSPTLGALLYSADSTVTVLATLLSPALCIALCPCLYLLRPAILKLSTRCPWTFLPSLSLDFHTQLHTCSHFPHLLCCYLTHSTHSSPATHSLITHSAIYNSSLPLPVHPSCLVGNYLLVSDTVPVFAFII